MISRLEKMSWKIIIILTSHGFAVNVDERTSHFTPVDNENNFTGFE
jgi:hypothetical protein